VQLHPEVDATPDGARLLRNFALKIAASRVVTGRWRIQGRAIAQIRARSARTG